MLTQTITLSNGNTINYKIINGTSYHAETSEKVCSILENARINRQKIRIFLGDSETGRDWTEEYDTTGTIGRSTGDIKVPLIIKNTRSMGGCAILDHCIVKITIDKRTVYQHPTYHLPNLIALSHPVPNQDYPYAVIETASIPHNVQARFKTHKQAEKYIQFLKGERNYK